MKLTTKEKILLNTLKLIDKNPFPKISTKQIANETGISEGAIFKHFKNKEELLQHLCDKFLTIVTTIDLTNISNETDFRKILISFFQNLQRTQNQVYKLVLYISMYKKSQFKIFNKIINDEVYKKIEEVVKNNIKNWNYNEKINIKIHVRLLMYSHHLDLRMCALCLGYRQLYRKCLQVQPLQPREFRHQVDHSNYLAFYMASFLYYFFHSQDFLVVFL